MNELGQKKAKRLIPLEEAEALADHVDADLRPYTEFLHIAGSIRRCVPTVRDIEWVVMTANLEAFVDALSQISDSPVVGGMRIIRTTIAGNPVEFYRAVWPVELGAMMLTYTGDATFNIAMRSKAKRRGWVLNQYGLYEPGREWIVQSEHEEPFFEALGIEYKSPMERTKGKR